MQFGQDIGCQLCESCDRIFLFRMHGFGLYRCKVCGLVYMSPQPSIDELAGAFEWSHSVDEDRRVRRAADTFIHKAVRQIHVTVRRFSSENKWKHLAHRLWRFSGGGAILDVGCGDGAFLAEASEHFDVTGCDISTQQVQFAQESYRLNNVVLGTIFDVEVPNNHFDVCVMHSYLEHEKQPESALRRAFELLKPGGLLYIKVPNYNSWLRSALGRRWRGYRFPHHLVYFTPKTLKLMIQRAGFSVISNSIFDRLPTNDNMHFLVRKTAMVNDVHRGAPVLASFEVQHKSHSVATRFVRGERLRVLHVEWGRRRLGGATQVLLTCKGLEGCGINTALLCTKGSAIEEVAEQYGIKTMNYNVIGDGDPRLFWATWHAIRQFNPHVVHVHGRKGAESAGLIGRLSGVPVLLLHRRVDNSLYPFAGALFRLLFDNTIAISHAVMDALLAASISPRSITRIASAVDGDFYTREPGRRESARKDLGLDADSRVVLSLGQMIDRKGHRHLIAAVPRIRQAVPKAIFLLAGEGPLLKDLRRMTERDGTDKFVHFLGFREDVHSLLHAADVLAHPATMEGLGVAILEAMAAELPVVACATGGIVDVVRHQENGLLVPSGDSEALASAITEILMKPHLADRLGRAGGRWVREHHSVSNMVSELISVYRRAFACKRMILSTEGILSTEPDPCSVGTES